MGGESYEAAMGIEIGDAGSGDQVEKTHKTKIDTTGNL